MVRILDLRKPIPPVADTPSPKASKVLRLPLSPKSHSRATKSRITGRTLQARLPSGPSQATVCETRLRSCTKCGRLTLSSVDWTSHRRHPFRRREAAMKLSLLMLRKAERSPNKQLELLCHDAMLVCPTDMCVLVCVSPVTMSRTSRSSMPAREGHPCEIDLFPIYKIPFDTCDNFSDSQDLGPIAPPLFLKQQTNTNLKRCARLCLLPNV